MDRDVELVWSAEEALLRPATRADASALERLLDEDFREIGASGRVWSRAETIAALATESPAGPARLEERHAELPAPGLVLLTYRVERAGRASWRCSLWRVTPEGPRLLFQQGTPVH